MGKLKTLAPLVAGLAPRVKAAPKVAEQFYSSREWRSLVASIKRERGDRCERPGCTTPTPRVIAAHIVERKDGGADLDAGHIGLLCIHNNQRRNNPDTSRQRHGT